MDAFRTKRVLLLFYGYITACIGQTIVESPVHTAAIVNDEVRFNYSATFTAGTESVKWGFYDMTSGTASLRTIWTTAGGLTEDALPYFDVDDSMTNEYDLIVLKAEEKVAGKYFAGFAINDQMKVEPQLVVLSEMTCSPTPGDTVDEGNYIDYMCSVQYTGYKKPRLRWMKEDNTEVIGIWTEDETTRTITLTANMTADWELDRHVMTCHLDFTTEVDEVDPAPTFTHQCQTHYEVTYHPNQLTIYPDPDSGPLTVYEGEQINCTGNGNPDPTYAWYCDGAYYPGGDQILVIEGDLIKEDTLNSCNCTATNIINGVTSGYFKTVGFYAYPDPSDSSGGGSASAGVIAAAVIIPLVFVAIAVAVGVYFFMKKRNQSEKPKAPPSETPHSEPLRQPSRQPVPTSRPPPSGGAPPRAGGPPAGGQPTPFTTGQTRQGYPGRGSPGYADLGVRGLSGSVPGLNQSNESLPEQRFYQPGQNVNHNPSGSQV